jgi:peptidoglycan/xylan/chitin deacetylase (PgdA/CDA1 family)
MSVPWKKRVLAGLFDRLGVNWAMATLERQVCHPFIRAVNYHCTPAEHADSLEAQLQYYAKNYTSVGLAELDALLRGEWTSSKPGLLISFDDGRRDQAEIAAPLLEKYGLTGWFFPPTGFLDAPPDQQQQYAQEHQVSVVEGDPLAPAIAMTWEQLRQLDQRHVIGCHTASHCRLRAERSEAQLHEEISQAKQRLEAQLGREVQVFCWVGGEEWAYSAAAARAIREAGFRYSFMTNSCPITPGTDPLQLQRSNIEVPWSLPVVRFQLCGFMDVLYTAKRRRVNALTR